MNPKENKPNRADFSSILGMLSDFQAGDFSKTLPSSENAYLKPLVDKLNETARKFEAQAQLKLTSQT